MLNINKIQQLLNEDIPKTISSLICNPVDYDAVLQCGSGVNITKSETIPVSNILAIKDTELSQRGLSWAPVSLRPEYTEYFEKVERIRPRIHTGICSMVNSWSSTTHTLNRRKIKSIMRQIKRKLRDSGARISRKNKKLINSNKTIRFEEIVKYDFKQEALNVEYGHPGIHINYGSLL